MPVNPLIQWPTVASGTEESACEEMRSRARDDKRHQKKRSLAHPEAKRGKEMSCLSGIMTKNVECTLQACPKRKE
jgi:hypothetical protein